jgi:hypothetical protein
MIKRTIFKKVAMPLVCLMMLVGLSAPALAYTSTELEDSTMLSHTNDTIATAQSISGPIGTSNPSLLKGTIKDSGDIDFYSFLYQKKATSNGRFSIKLSGIQSGNSYYLYLVDGNNKTILSSTRSGNQNQIIRVPANTLVDMTTYYIKVVPITVATPGASYNILMEDNMLTTTTTVGSGTYYMYSTNGQKSPSALVDMRTTSSDPNATVLSVSVSANKNPSPTAYNYLMYVTSNTKAQQNQWYTANWNSEVTGLKNAGVLLKDYWNVAFSATSLVSGVNIVGINTPKLTFTYEYDSTAGY